jgi:hypothetical protein
MSSGEAGGEKENMGSPIPKAASRAIAAQSASISEHLNAQDLLSTPPKSSLNPKSFADGEAAGDMSHRACRR